MLKRHPASEPEAKPADPPASPGEIDTLTFNDVARIRKVMKATRPMLTQQYGTAGYGNSCRLVWRKSNADPELLSTNGDRMSWIQLDAVQERRPTGTFDLVIPDSAVRALASCSGDEPIQIGNHSGACVTARGCSTESWRRTAVAYIETYTFSLVAFERVLNGGNPYAPVALAIDRTKVLTALRKMPKQTTFSKVVRLALTKNGVRAWPTAAWNLTAEDGPGVLLTARTTRCDQEVIIGVHRKDLTETLRTMLSPSLSLRAETARNPIHIYSDAGGERCVIATKRLDDMPRELAPAA